MSIPYCANGHGFVIGLRTLDGMRGMGARLWYRSHFLT